MTIEESGAFGCYSKRKVASGTERLPASIARFHTIPFEGQQRRNDALEKD
jgi:hypothetical protein